MLKFECKMSSWSKCWNLSEKGRLIKMSKFEWKGESIKTLQFEDKLRINQNAEIWVLHVIFDSIKMLKFKWKGNSQSKCWNLSANVGIYQNGEIYLSKKGEIDQMLVFYYKSGNRSICCSLIEK